VALLVGAAPLFPLFQHLGLYGSVYSTVPVDTEGEFGDSNLIPQGGAALAGSAPGSLARWRVGEDVAEQRRRAHKERVVERARRGGGLAGELGEVE